MPRTGSPPTRGSRSARCASSPARGPAARVGRGSPWASDPARSRSWETRYCAGHEQSSCVTQNMLRVFVIQMSTLQHEPWRELSPSLADVIEPELPALRDEILAVIAEEVPEYARPPEGSFGRGIRLGVEEAPRQFARLVADPDGGRGQSREVYVGLGRGEMREGRSLDALQAAYPLGARVAWRRLSE